MVNNNESIDGKTLKTFDDFFYSSSNSDEEIEFQESPIENQQEIEESDIFIDSENEESYSPFDEYFENYQTKEEPKRLKKKRKRSYHELSLSPLRKKRKTKSRARDFSSVEIVDLTQKYRELGSFHVVGRDKVVNRIIRLLSQNTGSVGRPLLIGSPVIGKKAIMKKVAESMATFDNNLENYSVIYIDCSAVMSNLVISEDSEFAPQVIAQKINKIRAEYLSPILFFHHVDAFLEFQNMKAYLKGLFSQSVKIVASLSDENIKESEENYRKLLERHRFQTIQIGELPLCDVKEVVCHTLEQDPMQNGKIVVSKEALSLAIKLADKYYSAKPFPTKVTRLIYEAASLVWMNRGEKFKIPLEIGKKEVAEVVAADTKVAIEDLMANSLERVSQFPKKLKEVIIGQDQAIKTVCSHLEQCSFDYRMGGKPKGVFLFLGPTGVGKTLMAEQIAEILGTEVISINMEGYREESALSKLIGANPGYVGYGKAGALDGPLAKNPGAVVLLDEMEKADSSVIEYFLSVFDRGKLGNGQAECIDCQNTLFIMTSNIAAKEILKYQGDSSERENLVLNHLESSEKFSPEFINRIDEIVTFNPLEKENCPEVVQVELMKIANFMKSSSIDLTWREEVIDYLSSAFYDKKFGMRALTKKVGSEVNRSLVALNKQLKRKVEGKIELTVGENSLEASYQE